MKFTAQQIAAQLEGTVDGDPNAEIFQLSKIEDAKKGSLTFRFFCNHDLQKGSLFCQIMT